MAADALQHLGESPAAAVRHLGNALLDDAAAAIARLAFPGDAEALHDMRVALRRLRSLLRAYRPLLPRAGARGMRRRLRELARLTGEARDLEVQIAWLRGQHGRIEAEHRAIVDEHVARMVQRHEGAMARVRHEAQQRFPSLKRRLAERLAEDEAMAREATPAPVPFAVATAVRILTGALALESELRAVVSPRQEMQAHRARIAGKRLRYLVEPLQGDDDGSEIARPAAQLVKQLKRLQDVLGDLHDAHVMGHVVERALVAAASARARHEHRLVTQPSLETAREAPPDPRAALLALDRLVCALRDELFARLRQEQERHTVEALVEISNALARQLAP